MTEIAEKLNRIAREYQFGSEEFSFFVGLADKIEKPIRIRKDNKMIEEMNKEMNFEELKKNVEEWADDKNLLHEENAEKQFMKFIEEVFEFKSEMDVYFDGAETLKSLNKEYMKDEMGDVFVTLIILCKQLDIDPVECLDMAYEKISKRRGKTIDGTFVKEEDL